MTDWWLSHFHMSLIEQDGVVFNSGRGRRKLSIDGPKPLWSQQSMDNHSHPFDELTDIPLEVALIEAWRSQFYSQMPGFSFVIEVMPIEAVTWYQWDGLEPVHDGDWDFELPYEIRGSFDFTEFIGPYEDDLSWDEFEAAFRVCLACQLDAGFFEPFIDPVHRGIQWKQCKGCGRIAYHGRRTIREVVWAQK